MSPSPPRRATRAADASADTAELYGFAELQPARRAAPRPGPSPALGRPHHGVGRERGLLTPTGGSDTRSRAVPDARRRPPAALGGGGVVRSGRRRHHAARRGVAAALRHLEPRAARGRPPRGRRGQPRPRRTGVRRRPRRPGLRPPGARHRRRPSSVPSTAGRGTATEDDAVPATDILVTTHGGGDAGDPGGRLRPHRPRRSGSPRPRRRARRLARHRRRGRGRRGARHGAPGCAAGAPARLPRAGGRPGPLPGRGRGVPRRGAAPCSPTRSDPGVAAARRSRPLAGRPRGGQPPAAARRAACRAEHIVDCGVTTADEALSATAPSGPAGGSPCWPASLD